jgi:protein-glutamine gamma-glutamyltransferase
VNISASSTGKFQGLSRALAPAVRLFGPQTSSAARERRDTLVLLLAVALVVVPHFEHLAWWATSVVLLLLVWRVWLTLAQRPLPGRFIMLPLLLAAGGAVYLQHRTLAGQDAGVTFLLLLMALKLLEMRARRDIFVVIFLAFFILLTQFLYGQDLPVAAITVAAVVALFFVLVSVNLDDVDLPAMRKLRLVGITLLKAMPLAAALFLLFPRISGPLWGMPGESRQGKTGLSNSMSPGSISQLLESDAIVFRVRFDNAVPGNDKLYWRGPVFGSFNGRSWTPLTRQLAGVSAPNVEGEPRSAVGYEMTLEPHKRDWLFALDVPAALPALASFQTRFTPEMQLLVTGLIVDRIRYDMRSYTGYRLDARATELELQEWLGMPRNFNPRAMQFAAELRSRVVPASATQRSSHDSQLVNAVLDHFRRGDYRYTMSPPPLGRHSVDEFLFDTRLGFCEHYASAFVFLMRALDVPARVVTGYQGGELNPVDGFMTVRQADAHAWTEVWLAGRGWVRVDPTAVVAPFRIERGAAELARQASGANQGLGSDMSWLRSLRYNWEAAQNGWNQWVLSYSQESQRALVERLGLTPSLDNVALVLALVMGALLAWLAIVSMRPQTVHDPLGASFQLLRDRLEHAGVAASVSCGPRELFVRSKRALVDDDVRQVRRLLSRYERLRYGPASVSATRADVRSLRRAIRAFKPRPNPL